MAKKRPSVSRAHGQAKSVPDLLGSVCFGHEPHLDAVWAELTASAPPEARAICKALQLVAREIQELRYSAGERDAQ